MDGFELRDVTVVSVCYHSDGVIGGMVASVPQETPIVLVDNGGGLDDDCLDGRVVRIVRLAANEGFGRGCNAGAAVATTHWLLFLNPDARLETGALEALLSAAKRNPKASAFNPRMANSDGSAYFKRRSYLLTREEFSRRGWPGADCDVPVLSGAALFVSKAAFDKVGGFDPEIFLYHEDDDLSLRLSALGPLMHVHDSLVVHAKGRSSDRTADIAALKAYHMARSRIYAGRKHGRPAPRLFACLVAFMMLASPQNLFSARKRAKAVGFLRGALSKQAHIEQ
ncbi:MAG TPA: glycosyltransferase family 2 protein [Ensifer sp.]|nr:glycosyltransferase family 2 protein [Ensifer sp.]